MRKEIEQGRSNGRSCRSFSDRESEKTGPRRKKRTSKDKREAAADLFLNGQQRGDLPYTGGEVRIEELVGLVEDDRPDAACGN